MAVKGGLVDELHALRRKALDDAQEIKHLNERSEDQSKEIRRLRAVVEKWQPIIEDVAAMRRVLGLTSKTKGEQA